MCGERLTWEEIKKQYDQEWVELVDYDWPDQDQYPRSGVVRVHAPTRSKFDDLADIDPPFDSAYIFVGETKRSESDPIVTRGYSRVIFGPKNAPYIHSFILH